MLIVISIMLCGVAIGYKLRNKNMKLIAPIIMWLIFLLLFFLGVSVGSNAQIMDNLSTIGTDAVVITFGAVLGSCLAALLIYKLFFKSNRAALKIEHER
ncbi:MAG: LysO family transporter [Rikenellaceae bacterium]